jgi:hypothetical protein
MTSCATLADGAAIVREGRITAPERLAVAPLVADS